MSYFIACSAAAVLVALQATLTRGMTRASSGTKRGLLLAAKVPLWMGFFIALSQGGAPMLLTGGLAAILGYLVLAGLAWWRAAHGEKQDNHQGE